MPVQNPFGLSFSGNITQWDSVVLSPPSPFGTCPGVGCCSSTTQAIPVNASLFVGSCTALTATAYGSPSQESLNVYVVNPLTVTFTESSLPVTQGTSPWVVSGTVAISNASICVTQCTSPWVVSGTVAFSNTTIAVTNTGTFAVQATIPTPTDWGTAPATSVLVPAVNAEMFVGQNAVSGTNPVPVSATTAANTSGNPIFVDVTNFPATSTFQGNLTNNNAAPNAFNVGVLPAIAETAYTTVTYTTGDQVLPVTDLHGALNVDWQALAGAALGGPTIWGTAPTGEEVQGVNAYSIQGTSPWVVSLTSTTITGTVAVTQSGTWTVQQGGAPWSFTGTLTNNNAVPAANNIGVLPAIAESAYTNLAYTSGDQVLPATDLHGALFSDLAAVAGVALGATAVVGYGSTPAAVNVPAVNAFITNTVPVTLASTTITGTVAVTQSTSPWVVSGTVTATIATPTDWGTAPATSVLVPAVNAEMFVGQNAVSGTNPVPVSATTAANASGNPIFVETVPGSTTVVTGTVAVTQSTSPWVVSLASTTITGTVAVTQSTSPWVVDGTLTNNNAAPTATLLGVLGAIAETAYNTVTYTTGDMVLPVTDLHGALNSDLQAVAGVQLGATGVTAFGTAPAAVNVPGVNSSLFSGTTALTNTGGSLNVNLTNNPPTTGSLSNNTAAPVADNVGVLGFIAETAYTTITYTTGNQVLAVTDLHGAINTDLQAVAGTAVVTAAAGVQEVGIVGSTGVAMDTSITPSAAATNALQVASVYNSTAITLTTGEAAAVQSDTTGSVYVNNDGRKKTYSAFATWTPVAGDICIMPGNATNIVRVHRVEVSMSTTGTAGVEQIQLIKRSVADTGGTSAAMTAVPHDSAFAAAASIPHNYTAAPALGAAVGPIRGVQFFDDSAAATGANTWLWTFGDGRGGAGAIVLRGAAQQLNVNLGGVIATQTVTVSYEWTEE